jgi:hypothetical protein
MDEQQLADLLARLDRRRRRFPKDARCAGCGERNPLVLCRQGKQILCQACRLARQERAALEEHHVGGRPSPVVQPLPANLHRLLTVLQELWRGRLEPGSTEAQLFDLVLLRVLGPSFGVEV